MSGPTYVRMYQTDWRSGCMGLTLEQEGLYVRICMFQAEAGRRVPLDDSQAARMLNCQTKMYRRVLGDLLRLGKIKRHDDGYGNDRIEHETAAAQSASKTGNGTGGKANQGQERQGDAPSVNDARGEIASENELNVERNSKETQEKLPVVADFSKQNQCPFIEPVKEPRKIDVVDEARPCAIDLLDGLQAKLEMAAAPALASVASHPGLLNLSIPLMWLEEGCDLDRDVLPTIAEIARKRAGKGLITHWNYFTQAIANAKEAREAGLPEGQALAPAKRTTAKHAAHGEFRAALERMKQAEQVGVPS